MAISEEYAICFAALKQQILSSFIEELVAKEGEFVPVNHQRFQPGMEKTHLYGRFHAKILEI